ncbi:MAG: hypothetical protein WD276_09955 [Actinomycetota bacterium]
MSSNADPPFISARMGHFSHSSDYEANPEAGVAARWKENYFLHPIVLSRPAEGVAGTTTRCGTCGDSMDVRVASPPVVMQRRIVFLVLAVALAAFTAFAYASVPKGVSLHGFDILLALGAVPAGITAIVFVVKGFSSEFSRAVVAPNKTNWKDSSHTMFPAEGELSSSAKLGAR